MSEQRAFRGIVRIAGTDCDGNIKLPYALARIKGVGTSFAYAVIRSAGLSPEMRLGHLTDQEVSKIEEIMRDPVAHGIPAWMLNRRDDLITGKDVHLIGPDVEIAVRSDIELMKKMSSWKGIRHSLGLKVRGQRTRTTGRTGRTIGVVRKEMAKK